ncbi:hypothetical protein M3Y99_00625100 [Aphelenchoides fujianensis]|nr:hypothetical protein M3Y99_00625100 [Aphelenchoides fujianensis]
MKEEMDEEEDKDEPGPSRGRRGTRKRRVKKEFACHFCGATFGDAATCVHHEITHLTPNERPAQTPAKSEVVTKRSVRKERPETRPQRPAPPSQAALQQKIEELSERKPTLLYLDIHVLNAKSFTSMMDIWKETPECKVLVMRVREVPLATKYELKRPTAIVPSTRSPTHFVFYCKKEWPQLADQIKDAVPASLSFCQLAGDFIPGLLLSSALLMPDAEDRATVDVAALALLNVFVV